MLKLEDIRKDAQVAGLDPNGIARVVTVEPVGTDALTVYFKTADGRPASSPTTPTRSASARSGLTTPVPTTS
jgi:hypothetical protein